MDRISKQERSKLMSAIRSKNTAPEIAIRKALFVKGYRYRIHYGPKKIDIAFPSKRLAIFIDGCFWHVCPIHSHVPKTNKNYWVPKLEKNAKRDKTVVQELIAEGWTVLRFWEHDSIDEVLKKIIVSLKKYNSV
jgi:DNA mismatch endonuclease, patch repair protein